MSVLQTKVNFKLGDPLGRRQRLKVGLWSRRRQMQTKLPRKLIVYPANARRSQSIQGNVSMSETRQKILEMIRRLETQMAGRMDEHRRFMDRSIEGDHTAKERADQVMRIWHRHRNEIAELKQKLTELD
jgi:hypothetical protein